MTEPLWTQREAAAYLRVSTRYLRRSRCRKRLLPSNTPGGRPLVRYDPDDVRAFDLERQKLRKAS